MNVRLLAIVLLILGVVAGAFDAPAYANTVLERVLGISVPTQPFRLGLDLQGGTHLVYQADVSKVTASEVNESMEGLRDVIERRVNLFGVTEPVVQVEHTGDNERLIVELAGVRDINEAIRLIGETPFLEFRTERLEEERTAILERQKQGEQLGEDAFFIPTQLTGQYLKRAELSFDNVTYQPVVNLVFDDAGSDLFAALTEANVGKQVAIYLDGQPISAPVVRQKITGGTAQISGNFTPDEARQLVRRLNSGALPVPIALVSQQSIEASLGVEAFHQSVRAGVYGLLAVALFMLLWYRLPGLVAIVALLLYTAFMLALFKAVPVTLTTAGIAGFILSIGMAVDANILIFERFKEEMRAGRGMASAMEEGFQRAWTSIRDSNVSSLITAAILYWFGSSLIKGFAVTLGIGIVVSMFSAIIVTRTFLRAMRMRDGKVVRFLFNIPS